jgi:hypothetical protein
MKRAIAAVLLVTACSREKPAPDVIATITPDPDDADGAAATAPPVPDAGVEVLREPAGDAGPGPAPASDVTLTLDGEDRPLRWAIAEVGDAAVYVTVFSWPMDCAHRSYWSLSYDKTPGARIELAVPPGPGGRYYAGDPIGVAVRATATDRKMRLPGPVGALAGEMSTVLSMGPAAVTLTLEPFAWQKGAHVRGRLSGSETMLLGSMAAKGAFDAELCAEHPKLRALAAAAPKAPVGARTVHAIVRRRPASKDEAIDQAIGRSKGSLPEIWMLVFYAEAKVPCPRLPEHVSTGHRPLLTVQDIGGTDAASPRTTPQPATALWPKGGNEYGEAGQAWVQIDRHAYTTGDEVSGSVWAQHDDGKSPFGGTFAAVVCAP